MDVSPQSIAAATFKTVKKGYDPDEVRTYLARVASSLESAHQQAAAMEARARAAIAKMQELAQQASHSTPPPAEPTEPAPAARPAAEVTAGPDEAETISRTLLLAQRTADLAVADARAQAEGITAAARDEATSVLDAARAEAAQLVDDARTDARAAKEGELARADEEVQSLLARRDFLLGDVDHLEHHVLAQRERLRDAIGALQDLVERVPAGLGEMRRPLLSAAAPEPEDAPSTGTPSAPGEDQPTEAERPAATPTPAAGDADLHVPDPATAIARPEPLVPLSDDQRSDLSGAWRAAEEADTTASSAWAAGVDDTQPIDVTPVDGQLRLDRAQPDSFRIGGQEL